MAKRGRCRCGRCLTFKKTAMGYKTRCPSCHAVVRLRSEPVVAVEMVDSQDDLEIRLPGSPLSESERPADLEPAEGGNWMVWAALGGAFVVIAVGVAVVSAN